MGGGVGGGNGEEARGLYQETNSRPGFEHSSQLSKGRGLAANMGNRGWTGGCEALRAQGSDSGGFDWSVAMR